MSEKPALADSAIAGGAPDETLDCLAGSWSAMSPGAVIQSVAWGPWEAGMATPELRRMYAKFGVRTIPVEHGAAAFVEEFVAGRSGRVVVGPEIPFRILMATCFETCCPQALRRS